MVPRGEENGEEEGVGIEKGVEWEGEGGEERYKGKGVRGERRGGGGIKWCNGEGERMRK